MIEVLDHDTETKPATDGDIAVINLRSARRSAWNCFWQTPQRPGIVEIIVEQEQLATQYMGDMAGFDRLGTLLERLDEVDAESPRTALIHAQVASMTHRFALARRHLAQAGRRGAPLEAIERLALSIDQACATDLDAILDNRRRMAARSGRLEDRVPLGALLADLREFDAADQTYRRALREYEDVSPFAMAWVCFQLGMLWGELAPEPQTDRAARWYERAIVYLPCYVKARVHLAEIYSDCDRTDDARALLIPAVASGDPEVHWRLADILSVVGQFDEAEMHMQAARSGFEALLEKHLLAFADHGAEFYSGSGNDSRRALELARINVANRPTLRAFEQAHEIAIDAGAADAAAEILAAATQRWGDTAAFRQSSLVQ